MIVNTNIVESKLITAGKNKGKAPLRFQFTHKKTRYIIGINERTLIKAWDKQKQKVTIKDPMAGEINKRIIKKMDLLNGVVVDLEKQEILLSNKTISKYFRAACDKEFMGIETKINFPNTLPTTFWEVVEHYRTNTKNTDESVRKWDQITTHLKLFDTRFDFSSIDEDFYNNYFLGYLVNVPLTDNSIDKHIAQIKMICTYALKRFKKIQIPIAYNDFPRLKYDPFRLSLGWNEVELIERFEPLNNQQKLARDLFIISCYTGLRWQDVSSLKKEDFTKKEDRYYFQIITLKNRKPLSIPVSQKVLSILEKYEFNIPNISNQNVNLHLHQIARACKLSESISVTQLAGGKPIIKSFKKYELVTMHVARHTFACEFLRRNKNEGIQVLKILSDLLNHSSTKVTEIYWKMIGDEKDKMLLNTF